MLYEVRFYDHYDPDCSCTIAICSNLALAANYAMQYLTAHNQAFVSKLCVCNIKNFSNKNALIYLASPNVDFLFEPSTRGWLEINSVKIDQLMPGVTRF